MSTVATSTIDPTMNSSSSKMKALSTTTTTETTTMVEASRASPPSPSLGENNINDASAASSSSSASSSLPLVSWKHGFGRKASAAKTTSWMALALTLDGRDKITKLLQYLSRFLAWYWLGRRQRCCPHAAARFGDLKVSLTNSRKAFRLGRTFMELQKLSTMNLFSTIVGRYYYWHERRGEEDNNDDDDDDESSNYSSQSSFLNRQAFLRRLSSNLGGPPPSTSHESTVRSVAAIQPAGSTTATTRTTTTTTTSKVPPSISTVSLIGSAMKLLGLAGFWAGDNISFLTSSGLFDNYQISDKQERLKQRKQLQTKASLFANRSYFMGALAGLVVNWRAYRRFRRETHARLEKEERFLAAKKGGRSKTSDKDKNMDESPDGDDDGDDDGDTLDKVRHEAQEKQFVLFVALLKSCCDVLVFSNNPGIDLWKKYRGYKLNEGVHCVAGLLSASTVLYNNFPNKTK